MTEQEKAAKRVELAKDVLAQLEARKFKPYAGSYQTVESDGTCELCALGALAVACCGMPEDEFSRRWEVLECLCPTFSEEQVDLIESAFECSDMSAYFDYEAADDDDETDIEKAKRLHAERCDRVSDMPVFQSVGFEEDEERHERVMRLIMLNIIKHNGTFVPEAL